MNFLEFLNSFTTFIVLVIIALAILLFTRTKKSSKR